MKHLRYLIIGLFLPQIIFAQQKLQLKDLLKNFYDFSALPQYLSNVNIGQESTYDRTGGNNDGFNGTYSFVRRNADSTLVLLDVKGAGVINRIWTPTPTDDSLDFYIDNDAKPSFSIIYRDLFTGKVYPFVAPLCANQLGGFYCYLPIPFARSCKIVLRGKRAEFHQIDYHLYPKGTAVKPFSLPLQEDEKGALETIKTLWAKTTPGVHDFYQTPFTTATKEIALKPSQTALLFEATTGGRIIGFEIESATALDELAKNMDLRVTYDGEQTPAVYCPLADYFGYAFGKASMKGLMVGADGKKHYSWFPMPFDKSAKIELVYRSANGGDPSIGTVNLLCNVYSTNQKRDAAQEGKFYAYWNHENPVPTGKPYTELQANGKGHFVGVALQAQGLVPGITGFFEGDDSTVVDGQMRMHGTGSEDSFNGGWYALLDRWDAAMSLPLSGSLTYSIPLSRTGGYRFYISDKVPFAKSFLQTIEHGPEHNAWPSDYTSVSYYYCDQSNTQIIIPNAENTRIYMPDTLQIFPQLAYTAMDNFMNVEAKWTYPTSAKTMFYTVQENSLIKMSLQDIPEGKYTMFLDYDKGPDAADFSLWQRQTALTDWMNANANKTERVPMQEVCAIQITNLNNSFSFHFKTPEGKNKFTLNRVILVRE
ncbi:DUF2961 domain-containing protein [Ilyomonas limi]|uniref:DUF2961 domain-containing protein n=1 Tax=Ilyomonas limi TaxID=2575867 RepID=A0A4U3L9F3_9BACT|nr:glycoside hydrolase family 172 protein [Ilyomonas limi]TKK71712.1 DUF2961 domain-containing protein [Ilyomonas limi]